MISRVPSSDKQRDEISYALRGRERAFDMDVLLPAFRKLGIGALLAIAVAGCRSTDSKRPLESNATAPPLVTSSAHAAFVGPTANSSAVQPANHVENASTAPQLVAFQPHAALPPDPIVDASLYDLVELALFNNPEIQAARWRARSLQQKAPQARALDDPMLMAQPALVPTQTADGPMDFMLTVSQKFPWFGKRALRGEAAEWQADAAFARTAGVQLVVVEQVKLAYFELYFLDRAIAVNRELDKRLGQVIEVAKEKFGAAEKTVGLETVLQAQVEQAQLRTQLVQLEQARVQALARLAQALYLPPGTPLDVQPKLAPAALPPSAEPLVAMIDACHPELEALRDEQRRNEAAIALAERNYYPDVELGYNWQAMGSMGLSPIATGEDSHYLRISANLPIYWEKLNAGVREAQYQAAQTTQEYQSVWAETRANLLVLYAQAVEHERVARILNEDILPDAQRSFDLSLEAWRVGRITFQQLIENYKTLLNARIEYHRRLAQREQAVASLERALGCAVITSPGHYQTRGGVSSEPEVVAPPQAESAP